MEKNKELTHNWVFQTGDYEIYEVAGKLVKSAWYPEDKNIYHIVYVNNDNNLECVDWENGSEALSAVKKADWDVIADFTVEDECECTCDCQPRCAENEPDDPCEFLQKHGTKDLCGKNEDGDPKCYYAFDCDCPPSVFCKCLDPWGPEYTEIYEEKLTEIFEDIENGFYG